MSKLEPTQPYPQATHILAAESIDDGRVELQVQCEVTEKIYSIVVRARDLEAVMERHCSPHSSFSYLSVREIELLISGISTEGWAILRRQS